MIHYVFFTFWNEKFNENFNSDINGSKDYRKEMIEIL